MSFLSTIPNQNIIIVFTPSLIQNAPFGAVMSDEDDTDCAFSMRKGVSFAKK
jgi:hypothetical protein